MKTTVQDQTQTLIVIKTFAHQHTGTFPHKIWKSKTFLLHQYQTDFSDFFFKLWIFTNFNSLSSHRLVFDEFSKGGLVFHILFTNFCLCAICART
jgi:hypothetical protein